MSKHTPGPWKWVIEDGDIEIRMGDAIESPGNHLAHNSFKYVDMIETYKKEQKEQAIANADLMTAAPELLNVAEYSLKIVENLPCECDSYNGFTCKKHEWERKLRKAINKAKGGDENIK